MKAVDAETIFPVADSTESEQVLLRELCKVTQVNTKAPVENQLTFARLKKYEKTKGPNYFLREKNGTHGGKMSEH